MSKTENTKPASRAVSHRRRLIGSGVAAVLVAGGAIAIVGATNTNTTTATLQSGAAGSYHSILINAAHHSLYILTGESATKLHCTSGCLTTWPPVLVKTAVSAVSVGTGVKGHISFVKRSSTYKQVLYNGLPIYRYSVDTAAGQAHGQGKVGPGGKWLLIHAAATTTAATPFNLPPTLQSVNPTGYTHILGNSGGRSMYVLSVESGGVLSCINTCPSIWPPLLVATSVTSIRVGTGVAGTIGFVTRSSTTKQVTFNGYPVYTYIGDAGAGTTTGQGIVADGGTWYLANAAATTNGTTQVTTPATTTTTASPYPGY